MTTFVQRPRRDLFVVGLIGTLGLLGGVLSASGRPAYVAIFIGLLVAALLASSRVAVFWLVVTIALVATGLSQLYLPGSGARYVRYVAPVASLVLLLHWVNDQLMAHPRNRTDLLPMPVVWAIAFTVTAVVSVLVNLSNPDVAVMGAKNYFQMGAFFVGVALLRWDHSTLDRSLVRALILLAVLQLPFALHQYLYLVPQRIGLGGGIVPADIVSGTFGATLLGGGANAVLAAFQIIVVGLLLALWKNGALSLFRMAALSLVLLLPLLVNQAKIAVLYLPLVFLVLFRRDFIVRPGKFLIAGVGIAGVFAVLMTALMLTHPSGRLNSWSELVDFVVARQTATIAERGNEYGALTRWTTLTFWAEEHATANPVHTLVGHGLGASREAEDSGLAHTLAEQKYPGLNIGHTAVSALLWDTGVIGLVTVLGMLGSAFFMAGSLARHHRDRDPFRCGLYEGLQAGIAVLTLGLAHKDFFVVHIPYQTITYLIVGYIANAWLEMVRTEPKRHARRRL
ncbi:MAG TPA: hypothetical protein VFI92_16215 [Steroidobacteraceae bacterium]|nr:hypothetical protein [Steroidobacteraceae bacterium]